MNPWMVAHDSLQQAIALTKLASSMPNNLRSTFRYENRLLMEATPFAWGIEPTAAVWAASKSVPGDTSLIRANLPVQISWWRFERPLEVVTISEPDAKIRALLLAWAGDKFIVSVWADGDPLRKFKLGVSRKELEEYDRLTRHARGFPIHGEGSLTPSQTWSWRDGETIDEMHIRCHAEHAALYGPGGRYEKEPQVDQEIFETASLAVSKFVVAGLAWMSSTVPGRSILETADGPIERHARKDYERKNKGRKPNAVRVIQLRRVEHRERPAGEPGDAGRVYVHRWIVGGHWRNQACGSRQVDRKLTWISPYMKGLDGGDLLPPSKTVFEVVR